MEGNWIGAFKSFDISGLVESTKKMGGGVKEKGGKKKSKTRIRFIKDVSS